MSRLSFFRYPATIMVVLAGIYAMLQPAGARSVTFVLLAMGAIGATEVVLGLASAISGNRNAMELGSHFLMGVGALGVSFAQLNGTPAVVYMVSAAMLTVGLLLFARNVALKRQRL